jgi:hypothetical protein
MEIAWRATPQVPSLKPFVTLALVVALVMAAAVLSVHAIMAHGQAALRVQECMNNRGSVQTWYNPTTGRHANVCEVEPGKFGIDVEENGNNVTAFIKEKLRTLEQVERYLRNCGYELMSGK